MPARLKHKEPIVDAAIRHFRRQGYPETRLNEIAESSGAPKGSIYYHFPNGKRSIAVAAVDEAGRRMAGTMRDIASRSASPAEFIKGFAEKLACWMVATSFGNACPMTSVLLELAPEDRDARMAGARAYERRFEVIQEVLEAAGYPDSVSRSIAVVWMSALNGALIQCRVYRSPSPLYTVGKFLGDTLEPVDRN